MTLFMDMDTFPTASGQAVVLARRPLEKSTFLEYLFKEM